MKASPISYVRDATLRGRLFDPEEAGGVVPSVDTGFWVDHTEPLRALAGMGASCSGLASG